MICHLTRSIRDYETSIDFVQGPPGSRRERVNIHHMEIYFFKSSSKFLIVYLQSLANKETVQWNLVITRSDKTKSSYNEVILLVPALYISLCFYPDIIRNLL